MSTLLVEVIATVVESVEERKAPKKAKSFLDSHGFKIYKQEQSVFTGYTVCISAVLGDLI